MSISTLQMRKLSMGRCNGLPSWLRVACSNSGGKRSQESPGEREVKGCRVVEKAEAGSGRASKAMLRNWT